MARRWGKVDFSELQAFQENLKQMEKLDMEEYFHRMSNELAARLLRRVRQRTPVGTVPKHLTAAPKSKAIKGASGKSKSFLTKEGAIIQQYWTGYVGGELRRNWTIKKAVTKNGTVYEIEIVNPTEYASYVEYGHRQQVGRYVPQLGRTLKKGWVEGKFMLRISEEEIQALAPKLLEKRLNEMLKGIFDVK